MTRHLAVVFALLLGWSPSLWADVVELRGGERIEGVLKEATPAAVIIEVAGQSIRFEATKVRAIYYGSPAPQPAPPPSSEATFPPPSVPSPAAGALQLLQSLRSAVGGSMTLRDYEARVNSAAPLVELYLTGSPAPRGADGLRDAMRYYVLAEWAWSNQGLTSRTVWLRKDEALQRCTAYQDFARSMQAKGDSFYAERMRNYVVIADGVMAVLWSCAAEKLAEAEKLVLKAKK
jgi:hypothetical protein